MEVAGAQLERFYHHIFSTDLDILGLIERLGLWDRLKWYKDDTGNWYQGRFYPFASPLEILRFSPVPLWQRLRLGAAAFYLTRLKDYRALEQVTARDWITSHMGADSYRVFWEPLLKAKFGAHAESICMSWIYGRVHSRKGPSKKGTPANKLGYLDGSVRVLVEALEARLKGLGVDLRPGLAVKRLVVGEGRVRGLETREGTGDFDRVLVTCATPQLLEIAGEALPAGLTDRLKSFRYYGSCVAILELKRGLSPHYWVSVLDTTIPFLAVIEQTRMISSENYRGETVLYLAKYLDPEDPFYRLPDDAVMEDFLGHLKRVFPSFDGSQLIRSRVMRARYTQPIITVGHGSRVPPHRLPVKGLYLCNMTQIYPEDRGMSYSIGLGSKVAGMMMDDAAED